MSNYSASDIRIFNDTQAIDRMPWLKTEALAAKYHRPLIFIQRGLESYSLAGGTAQAFVDRYLEKLSDAPRNLEAEAISRELQQKAS